MTKRFVSLIKEHGVGLLDTANYSGLGSLENTPLVVVVDTIIGWALRSNFGQDNHLAASEVDTPSRLESFVGDLKKPTWIPREVKWMTLINSMVRVELTRFYWIIKPDDTWKR